MKLVNVSKEHTADTVQISAELNLSTWTLSDLACEVGRKDSIFLLAADKHGTITGFVSGRVVVGGKSEVSRIAEIYNIGIREVYQKEGFGQLLLDEFVSRCKRRSVEEIWLEVRKSNTTAINFYTKNSFQIAGNRKSFYHNPVEDAFVMRRHLEPD